MTAPQLLTIKASGIVAAIAFLITTAPASGQIKGKLEELGELRDQVEDPAAIAAEVENAMESIQIESQETSFDEAMGIARASGNVQITYKNTIIRAEKAEYHQSTGDVFARENVVIFKDGGMFTAQEAIYNINTNEMTATNLRSSLEPVYYDAGEIEIPTNATDMIEMEKSWFTTHDSKDPNYRIKANRIKIFPGKRVEFHNVKFMVGDTPVLWLPYLSQPLDDELGYYFTPGYNTPWGAFLLNQYGFNIGDHTLAQVHLDIRSERGLAGGINLFSQRHRKNENFGEIQFYYANDSTPEMGYNGLERANPPSGDRYRVNMQHRVYLPGPDESTLYLDIDINKLSDEFFYNDFFPAEYTVDPNPDNILNLVKHDPRGTISLLGRFQLNEFFRSDERLPELAVDFTRQPIFDSGFFYQGNTSIGIVEESLGESERDSFRSQQESLEEIFAALDSGELTLMDGNLVNEFGTVVRTDFDPEGARSILDDLINQLDEPGFTRFHTYHEVLYPTTLGNVVSVVPRLGGGFTSYSDVEGPGETDSFDRGIFHLGLDTSIKFSKTLDGFNNPKIGLDGLRHIFQPYVNYSFLATDSDENFPKIDRLTPSTRLRPIDVPLYTAVDSLQDWNIVRTGMFNRFQTRRNGGTHNWLDMNTYFDTYIEDPEFDRNFSNLFQEVLWNPLPWLAGRVTAQLPVFGGEYDFTEVTTGLTFMPVRNFEFSIGNYYLQDHPFFIDSNLITLSTYTRLSDNWGFSTVHRFEADDSTLELQQYQIHRDLSSWTASIGGIVRDNRNGTDEYGIVMSLTLKAFPKLSVPIDLQPGGAIQ